MVPSAGPSTRYCQAPRIIAVHNDRQTSLLRVAQQMQKYLPEITKTLQKHFLVLRFPSSRERRLKGSPRLSEGPAAALLLFPRATCTGWHTAADPHTVRVHLGFTAAHCCYSQAQRSHRGRSPARALLSRRTCSARNTQIACEHAPLKIVFESRS